ncbi:MAG: lipocalin family protein [Bacteroidota bacterium]|nr:lipocalin family protein [Bacteroidota bacterium]MDX5405143.1 lipocalin family protein [Bacteroidota bacterium]MDX5427056.1 lipocalin family protein [Bacteroidota bacterium]MDX5447232.1 lipocalin family protein [Bacteroidota bacterium]MDX5505033.1 lipocalin family protein [Bacteroidota bacterium]
MKRLLWLLIPAMFFACKKDDDGNSGGLESNLPGTWKLIAVEYSGSAPNPSNPTQTVPFSGSGTNVNGQFVITKDPNTINYSMFFVGEVNLGSGQPISLPIQQSGSGTWTTTTDGKKLIMTNDSDGKTVTFNVITNTNNRQVWEGTLPVEPPGSGLVVNVDTRITLIR